MKTLQVTGWASVKTDLLPDNRVWVQATADNGDYCLVTWDRDGSGDTVEETYADFDAFDAATDALFAAVAAEYWPAVKAAAVKVSEVHGGWNHGFKVDVTYEGGEWKRVHLDRDQLVKDDGSYDMDYVATAIEAAAPTI